MNKHKISEEDFSAAKIAVSNVGITDTSLAHRTAMETLKTRCPRASQELIQDMGWQVVLSLVGECP